MKKLLLILFAVMMVFSASAQTITVLHSGDTVFGDTSHFKIAEGLLKKDYPNAKVEWMKVDLADGSTLTMDAMLAADEAPNIYLDTTVRTSKYAVPEYALPLNEYIRDLDKFTDLAMYKVGGKLYSIPVSGSAQGMCINLDIMKDIGFTVKPDWTINDFLKMAELVKQKYGGKKYATGMFAANQSGDYLLNNWYASFGVNWYENGDYSKALVAKNGGAKVYEFYQLLVKQGYVPPNSATLNDDDYAADWAVGKLAATAFYPSWTKPYFDTAIQQKLIEKPFNYAFVPFPRAPGVTKVGTYFSGSVAVVHKTGTEKDKIAARLVEYLNSDETENLFAAKIGLIPDKKGLNMPTDPHVAQVGKIIADNGFQDVGLLDRRFTERRSLQFPILQQVLNLKLTSKEGIEKFEKALNSVK